jgi:NADH:ubiquinone oxidoreductase subunit 2 (subunit N)
MLGGALYGWLFGEESSATSLHPILQQFSHSIFEITDSIDRRTLILELFIWVGVIFTLLSIPFVMWVKRVFRDNKIAVVLYEKK